MFSESYAKKRVIIVFILRSKFMSNPFCSFTVDAVTYSITFENAANSYVARASKANQIVAKAFGNGILAEEQIVEWMENPEAIFEVEFA
jgi:hypothetical protein